MTNRIEEVDFIKGIMIFLMVCFHIPIGYLHDHLTGWVYTFHMPVFFFYSGYFLSTSKPIETRLYKLFRSLIIPYVLFEILYISILFTLSQLGFNFSNRIDTLDISDVLYRVFIHPIGAYWYLHTLIICLLTLMAIEYLKIRNNTSYIVVIGLCFFCLSYCIEGFKFENVIFFVFGYYFKIFSSDIFPSALSLLSIFFIFYFGDTYRGSISSFGTTFFIISFLKFIYIKGHEYKFTNVLSYIGKNTLIIVLLHPIFLNFFKLIEKQFIKIDPTLILYCLINTTFTICLSLIVANLLDRIKISNLLFGRNIYMPYSES